MRARFQDRSWRGLFWKTEILGGSGDSLVGKFDFNEHPIGHTDPFSRLSQLSAQVEALPENLWIT